MKFVFYQIQAITHVHANVVENSNSFWLNSSNLVQLQNGRRVTKPGDAAQTLLSPDVIMATTSVANSEWNAKVVIF